MYTIFAYSFDMRQVRNTIHSILPHFQKSYKKSAVLNESHRFILVIYKHPVKLDQKIEMRLQKFTHLAEN